MGRAAAGSLLGRLSTFSRHIWFDPCGTGVSDRIAPEKADLSESMVDDMVAVFDAVGSERAVVMGLGAPQPLLFAATQPRRTTALVLVDAPAVLRRCEDNPDGISEDEMPTVEQPLYSVERVAPSLVDDERFNAWYGRASRLLMSPADRVWRAHAVMLLDLRPALSAIQAPTLIVSGTRRRLAAGQRLAADRIAGAKLFETDTGDQLFFVGDTGLWLDAIEEIPDGPTPDT